MRKVEVVPHDPQWRSQFEQESQAIAPYLASNLVAIHHIGSTSIPGIDAKPIIDILIEVQYMQRVDQQASGLAMLGYTAMGEYGIPGRRFFRKDNQQGDRTHHVHLFAVGDAHIQRHLDFRDYLRSQPEVAQTYSELKRRLAAAHPYDIAAYMDGKDPWIRAIAAKAANADFLREV